MIRIFKTTTFAKWAKKEKLADISLCRAIDEINRGLVDASLGGGLVKKRVAKLGGGRRGGFRTLIAFHSPSDKNAFYVFGFSKSDRGNIDAEEEKIYKELAQYYRALTANQIDELVNSEKLFEVNYVDEKR